MHREDKCKTFVSQCGRHSKYLNWKEGLTWVRPVLTIVMHWFCYHVHHCLVATVIVIVTQVVSDKIGLEKNEVCKEDTRGHDRKLKIDVIFMLCRHCLLSISDAESTELVVNDLKTLKKILTLLVAEYFLLCPHRP